jgi:hypothetical protein
MYSRRLLGLSAAVLAVALALGACNGDDGGSSDGSTQQSEKQERKERRKEGKERAQLACDVLPEADIQAVYENVGQGAPTDQGTCQWPLGTVGEPGAAVLLVSLAAPTPDAEQEFAELEATESGEAIADLGDEAIYTQGGILYVRSGDQTIAIQYFPLGSGAADPANPTLPPDQRAQLTQLAQTILANLENPPASS